jgi:hypothetical protein
MRPQQVHGRHAVQAEAISTCLLYRINMDLAGLGKEAVSLPSSTVHTREIQVLSKDTESSGSSALASGV